MTKQQDDAIHAAYLGIRVLRAILSAHHLWLGAERADRLVAELEQAFPKLKEQAHDDQHHRDRRA
jgi:hypothetical protein